MDVDTSPILEALDLAYQSGELPHSAPTQYYPSAALPVLIEWHRAEHAGRFDDCQINPCLAVRLAVWSV